MKRFWLGAVAIAVLYGACADPPKKPGSNQAGTGGTDGGEDAGGSPAGGTENTGATSGSGGSTGGSGAVGGTGGGAGTAGTGATSGEGGEAALAGAGSGGAGEAGAGGAPANVDPCEGLVIGDPSSLPVPPAGSAVPKPAGAVGNLAVVDWAGFKGALSYTFDDGMASQILHYDELNAVEVPMTFYLVGNNTQNSEVWSRAVEDGHELGNHTMRHCNADGTGCGWAGTPFISVDDELDTCTAQLQSKFGAKGVYTFASPNGDNGWAAPASERFLVGRGVYDNPAGVKPNDSTNPFNLPCHISNKDETAAASATGGFNLIADDVRANHSWRIILNHSFGNDGGYNPTAIGEVVAAMQYAKGLQDVWLDTVVSIAAYWRAQKTITPVVPENDGGSKVYSWTLPAHFPPGQYLRVKVSGGTPKQCGTELTWDDHGYYEIALDAGSVTIAP